MPDASTTTLSGWCGSRVTGPVDTLVRFYLGLTAAFLVLGLSHPPAGHTSGELVLRILWHVAVILLIPRLGAGWLARLYPFVLLIPIYSELEVLNRILSGVYYDATVLAWETRLLGPSPAAWLSQVLPYRLLSEWLHMCYLLYYVFMPILVLRLRQLGQTQAAEQATFTGLATIYSCYLVVMFFPVQGPRPLWPPLDPACQGIFWSLCHALTSNGAVDGGAFPSTHVAFSSAAALAAWRYHPGWRWLYCFLALSIALATVYGRLHYMVDVLAGWAVALAWALAGPTLYQRIQEKTAGPKISGREPDT